MYIIAALVTPCSNVHFCMHLHTVACLLCVFWVDCTIQKEVMVWGGERRDALNVTDGCNWHRRSISLNSRLSEIRMLWLAWPADPRGLAIFKNEVRSQPGGTASAHKHDKLHWMDIFLGATTPWNGSRTVSCSLEDPWPRTSTCSTPSAQSPRAPQENNNSKKREKWYQWETDFREELTLDPWKFSNIPGHSGNVTWIGARKSHCTICNV